MNTLLIYCHPHDHSHNHRILQAVQRGLDSAGVDYEVLDLYRLEFRPMLSAAEYERMFVTHERRAEEDVKAMQARVSNARNLVFIYPVWWYTMPACLKGFIDRVFAPGFAYRFFKVNRAALMAANLLSYIPGVRYLMQPHAATGLLKGKRAFIFRSYGGPALGRRVFGNTPAALENVVLRFCGITNITLHELYNVNKAVYTQTYEDAYLRRAERIAAGITNG